MGRRLRGPSAQLATPGGSAGVGYLGSTGVGSGFIPGTTGVGVGALPPAGPVPSATRSRGTRGIGEDRKANPTGPAGRGPQPTISELPLPSLSPESTANYYAQLATISSQLATDLAASRAARVGLKADASVARADAKQEAIGAMTSTVNNSIERNMVGSSVDVAGRVGVEGALASARADINSGLRSDLAASHLTDQATALQYQLSGQQLEGDRIAEQQAALRDALENNTILSGMESSLDAIKKMYEARLATARDKRRGTPPVPGNGPGGSMGVAGPMMLPAPADVVGNVPAATQRLVSAVQRFIPVGGR